ncbi:venom metalloproteinase antarease-like TserMP_B [Dermacentor andersoni]|uniref:venom metalloproteinase antarease-like TserMP_B n=1 Tax=Dermacentor andersoni TaxID=34620 RepID=UPI0024173910|nr:A disintegrin and metalloproteinase with thrombospondin motifs like [Dermacentor andersoni]
MPGTVTVEVYVVSDLIHNKKFTNNDLLLYICIFMNTINAIFMSLTCPKVRVALVGVEKSSRIDENEYIFGNDKLMNDMTSLNMFKQYAWNKKKKYGNPDIVLLLTGRDVYESTTQGLNKNIAGIAYEGGICTDSYVALAEDVPGSFSGVIDTAHELGHSLGASHDGSEPNNHIRGHPGSKDCSASSGHLMTYVDGGSLRYRFSECNQKEIRHVLRVRGQECWKMNTAKIYTVEGVYPGSVLKPTDYCKRFYRNSKVYSSADYRLKSNCKMKCCALLSSGYTCVFHPMLDYMSCSYKKKCFQGVCTSEKDLPKYRFKNSSMNQPRVAA